MRSDHGGSSEALATWWEELTHSKRTWCWKRLRTEEGWIASLTQWTWVWAHSRRQWRTGKPGMLQSIGSQWIGNDWVTKQENIRGKEKDENKAKAEPRNSVTEWMQKTKISGLIQKEKVSPLYLEWKSLNHGRINLLITYEWFFLEEL